MLILGAAAIFILVAAGTMAVVLYMQGRRARGVKRLTPVPLRAAEMLPPTAHVWRELVDRIGAIAPMSERDLPKLRKRLIRAGFRGNNAAPFYQGARLVGTISFSVTGLLWSWNSGSTVQNVLWATIGGAVVGSLAPSQYVAWCTRRRQKAIARGLPNALDLMVVCVESGLGIDQTTLQVARELQNAHPEICSEFTVMNLELHAGKRRAEALHNLAERTGVEDVKKLVAVLVQTDRFGTSIAQCLRGHADYLRVIARQKAEEKASKLAVKLVFPIFFCVLPSLFVVTIGPVMTRLVRDLVPVIENM
ncbi:MAG: type II secretion system F family protein [Candidatus Solibacter sp.]